LEDSYRQQDCPLLEEDSSDDESDDISSSSDLDDSSRKEDIFGKSQLPTSLTSRSELLLPTTDEKLINIIPKKLQIKAQSHLNSTAISTDLFKECCSSLCLRRISPGYESFNFEPCIQFIRERRKDMLDKSLPEQITMLKTYISNSMNQSSKHHGSIFLQQRYKFETIVEGHSFCGKGFCHLFGITYYLRKRLIAEIKNGYVGVTYGDKEGKNLNTIDEETARSIEKLLHENKILISNSMKANLRIPDSEGIGYVRLFYVISTYLLAWNNNYTMMYHY
jgi:hypothetical protein